MARIGTRSTGGAADPGLGFADNYLLAGLLPDDFASIAPHLERISLPPGRILFEPGDRITHAWFPAGAVFGLLVATNDGRVAEAGTIGREGALGVVGSNAERPAFTRGLVQIGGPALRIELDHLEAARQASSRLGDLLKRYADALLAQVLQSVACNALHSLEGRCARWLLTSLDRQAEAEAQPPAVRLTQEQLATMLGAHRVSVTAALSGLEAQGVVRRARGRILIADRAGLTRRSCECYAVVRAHYDAVLAASGDGTA
jgi:CRP-like cAMP-binding protein